MSDEKDDKKSDDPLEGIDEHLQDPAIGARKAGEPNPEETVEDDKSDDKTDNKDEETESESKDDDLTLQDKHDYLKTEVGRQANEIGNLKKEIAEMKPAAAPVEPQPDPLQEKLEKARKLYGPEIVDLMVDVAKAQTAPVQQAQGIQALKDRYKDFDDVRADMDKMFTDSPALREAATKDVNVLDTVYAAAKAKVGGRTKSESTQKEEARRKVVNEAKDEAFVEKPSQKADAPKKATQKEINDGFVDHLITLPVNA